MGPLGRGMEQGSSAAAAVSRPSCFPRRGCWALAAALAGRAVPVPGAALNGAGHVSSALVTPWVPGSHFGSALWSQRPRFGELHPQPCPAGPVGTRVGCGTSLCYSTNTESRARTGSVNVKCAFKVNVCPAALLKAPGFHLLQCDNEQPIPCDSLVVTLIVTETAPQPGGWWVNRSLTLARKFLPQCLIKC